MMRRSAVADGSAEWETPKAQVATGEHRDRAGVELLLEGAEVVEDQLGLGVDADRVRRAEQDQHGAVRLRWARSVPKSVSSEMITCW